MNEIQYNQSPDTFSQVVLIGLGIALATHAFQAHPVTDATMHINTPFLQQSYCLNENASTYNSYAGITGEYISAPIGFEQTVGSFYARLLTSQEPLGAEFEKVLYENLWDLYES